MKTDLVLAIDQGTTNTEALVLDSTGTIVARASRPLTQNYPHPAWVEQDPLAIWHSVREVIEDCLQQLTAPALAAVAITNQRETVMLWERHTGQPLGPCVVWQCRRTAPFCEELRGRGLEGLLRERTGLTIDPLFSASKARWLLEHTPQAMERAKQGDLCLGTMDSWVLWNLTGGAVHACDASNASRTQLLNIWQVRWDPELLDIFGIPPAALPEVKPSGHVFGMTSTVGHLPAGIPIASLIGDSHAALFGQAGFQPGSIKATYGTGSSLMTPTSAPVMSGRGLSTTIAWARDQVMYALEGNITVTGAAVQWFGEFLGLPDPAAGVAALAAQVNDTDGVYLVPAFVGLGAPYWDDMARGLITGLTRSTKAEHLARAALEAIAYQVRDVFDVMQAEAGAKLDTLLADGGATRNEFLMQFQADVIGCPVLRSLSPDVSALGAAYLAGLTVGLWASESAIAALPRAHDRFEPQLSQAERDRRYGEWRKAVARTMFRPEPGE
jgi:glycerol kinase